MIHESLTSVVDWRALIPLLGLVVVLVTYCLLAPKDE